MGNKHVHVRIYFDMHAREIFIRAVAIHGQIVHTEHFFVRQNSVFDVRGHLLVGGLTNELGERFSQNSYARPSDEQRYERARIAVDIHTCEFAYKQGE